MALTLKEILKTHEAFSKKSELKNNLGDGYLIHHNPLYRNIRESFNKLGYVFTTDDFCYYRSMLPITLTEILRQKKVMYLENLGPLKKIESTRPGEFNTETLPPIGRNLILHESTHCIIHEIIEEEMRKHNIKFQARDIIFQMLLSESFAGAVEYMGRRFASDEMHQFFYSKNVNFGVLEELKSNDEAVVKILGFKGALQLMMFSWLHFNFLYTEATDKMLLRSLKLLNTDKKFSEKEKKSCLRFFKFGLNKNENNNIFRAVINPFYLHYNYGIREDYNTLIDFDPLGYIEENKWAFDVIQKMSQVCELGIKSSFFMKKPQEAKHA